MADQPITGLPTKTASGVASTDKMLGIDSAEGYQILVRDVAKYILENCNVSTLAGAVQTPKAAIDALYNKCFANLPNNTDFNTITNSGCYSVYSTTNAPDSNMDYWSVWVQRADESTEDYLTHYAVSLRVNTVVYTRVRRGGTWYDWLRLARASEVDALNDKTDLTSQITMNTGFSISNGSFIKQGRIYILNIVVNADSPFVTSPQTIVGSIPQQHMQDNAINFLAGIASGEWDTNDVAYSYVYNNIVIRPNVTGMSYAKLSCVWAK